MSQHDLNIANQGFPAFRADLNDALVALGSTNSGATAPATTYANQLWYDTANNILKIRNEDNDAWISIATLDQSADTVSAITAATVNAGALNATGVTTVQAGTAAAPAITTTGDTNTGIFFPAADTIAFAEGGAEVMRIDADGDLGVGTNNPQYRIDVQSSSGEQIARFRATTGTTQSYLTLQNNGTMYVGLDNSTGSAITNSAYAPFIYSSTDAPMSFFTNATRNVTFQQNGAVTLKGATQTSSGTGITFPATQSASSDANTLDDYEEGTWTPTVFGSTTAGTTTYTVQKGFYTKIGRVITITFKVAYSAATGTGSFYMGGIPFISTALGNNAEYLGSVMTNNLNMPNNGSYAIYTVGGASQLEIYSSTDDASLQNAVMSNESAEIWGTITYFTA
jgi:hypothetical protein